MEDYKDLTFSTFQLFIDESFAELKNFNVNDKWSQNFSDENQTIHNIICKIMNERYFTLYDNFGSPTPRPNHIYDIPTKTKILNPRKNSQAELKRKIIKIVCRLSFGLRYFRSMFEYLRRLKPNQTF